MPEFGNNLNRIFVENIRDPGLRKEAEERSQAYLKLRVYEDSFMARVMPPKPISPSASAQSLASSPSAFFGIRTSSLSPL